MGIVYPTMPKIAGMPLRRDHPLSQGLVLAMNFDTGSGLTAYDNGPNAFTVAANNGTITGATWVDGRVGAAVAMTGNTEAIDVSTETFPSGNAPITLSCWFLWNGNGPNTHNVVMAWGRDASPGGFCPLLWLVSSKVEFEFGSSKGRVVGATTIATATWYHVASVYTGAQTAVYLNGKLDASPVLFSSANIDSRRSTDNAYIASICGALYSPFGNVGSGATKRYGTFNGLLDALRLYNRALSPAEVAEICYDSWCMYRPRRTQWLVDAGPAFLAAWAYRQSRRRVNSA